MLSVAKRLGSAVPSLRNGAPLLQFFRTEAGQPRRRNKSHSQPLKKKEEKSEWWIVDGEMHEIGDHVPLRERFAIPRDNIPNRRRKQLREQFMRRTRLVLKESVSQSATYIPFLTILGFHENRVFFCILMICNDRSTSRGARNTWSCTTSLEKTGRGFTGMKATLRKLLGIMLITSLLRKMMKILIHTGLLLRPLLIRQFNVCVYLMDYVSLVLLAGTGGHIMIKQRL